MSSWAVWYRSAGAFAQQRWMTASTHSDTPSSGRVFTIEGSGLFRCAIIVSIDVSPLNGGEPVSIV